MGSSSWGISANRVQATVVPAGRTRSSSRKSPRASASRMAAVLRPRSSSRRSPWKTSQFANRPSVAWYLAGPGRLMALWFLNADMDGDPLDLGDRAGDLDHLAVRNIAVGLENHFAASLL